MAQNFNVTMTVHCTNDQDSMVTVEAEIRRIINDRSRSLVVSKIQAEKAGKNDLNT